MTKTRLISTLASLALATPAFSQFAELADGTIVVPKVPAQIWGCEGPIFNIDFTGYTIEVTGRKVTIPATFNGEEFGLLGTEIVDSDGQNLGTITVAEFDRLSDLNALVRDVVVASNCDACGPLRMGPVRSIYSSSEARSASVAGSDRNPEIQRIIEDNYFNLGINLYARYMDVLPPSWLGCLGVRNAQGQYPTSPFQLPPRAYWKYPASTGGTLKAAGSVYVDLKGNEYLIPDPAECFIEFAENGAIGTVTAVRRGDALTPDSLLMGDMIVTINPDPRVEVAFLGIGGAPMSQEAMFELLESGAVTEISVGGYQVGEHMLFASTFEGDELYHPSMGIVVTADRFDARVDRGELQFRGVFGPVGTNTLWAEVAGQTIQIPVVADPLTGFANYDADFGGLNLNKSTLIDLFVRNAKGAEIHRVTFDFSEGIR